MSNRWGLLGEIMSTVFDEGMDVSRDRFFKILDGIEFLEHIEIFPMIQWPDTHDRMMKVVGS